MLALIGGRCLQLFKSITERPRPTGRVSVAPINVGPSKEKMALQKNSLVSVVVPSYNHRPFLNERMASIFSQSHTATEIIVLDDASEDGSAELLRELAEEHAFKVLEVAGSNGGSPFAQWLKGLARAEGEYLWIAESDDTAEPEFLETMVDALERWPEAAFAAAAWRYLGPSGERYGAVTPALPFSDTACGPSRHRTVRGKDLMLSMVHCNPLENVSALLFRTSALRRASAGAGRFRYLGDWMTYVRLLAEGDLLFVDRTLAGFRLHDETTRVRVRSPERQAQHALEMLEITIEASRLAGLSESRRCESVERVFAHYRWQRDLEQDAVDWPTRIAIYGAGALGRQLLVRLRAAVPGLSVVGFIDARAREKPLLVEEVPVMDIDRFAARLDAEGVVIASVAYYEEILEVLVRKRLSHLVLNGPGRAVGQCSK